eukprot:14997779-Ditylum_brightwellii.AAC.1
MQERCHLMLVHQGQQLADGTYRQLQEPLPHTENPCNYDMIVGRDFLQRAGINLNFQHGYMEWLGQKVAMKATVDGLHSATTDEHNILFNDEAELDDKIFASEIKEAKYDAVSAEE